MTLIECKDGSKEYVRGFSDIVDIVREKTSDGLAAIIENEYDYDKIVGELFSIYNNYKEYYDKLWERRHEFADGKEHPEVAFMQLFDDITNLL